MKSIDPMLDISDRTSNRVLDPIERISEVLFGLIMVLTFTGTLSVLAADRAAVRTMLVGALGCNLAWGIIDAGMYLMARLSEQSRKIETLRAIRKATDACAAHSVIARALPPLLASILSSAEIESMRQKIAGSARIAANSTTDWKRRARRCSGLPTRFLGNVSSGASLYFLRQCSGGIARFQRDRHWDDVFFAVMRSAVTSESDPG
jgi:hypothetical protein